jgi:Cd2+/Zn2+-exporting ATPase
VNGAAESRVEEWKPMAVRSALCLVCAVVGWSLKNFPAVSNTAFVGAYLSGGWDLTRKVWEGLRELEFGTDFLMWVVALGAACIGETAEGAVLMFLFSASGAMERFAAGRTEREISALLDRAPKVARLLDDGGEREVPVAELRPGQRVRVTSGEQVPVDMQVERGESECDESMLTGESVPVPKARGDTAFAGTLNLGGVFEGSVLRAAEDSALQRIIRLIQTAQEMKAPAQRFTDRFGTRYTAIVLTLCTIVFFVWWLAFSAPPFLSGSTESAFYRAMTLLVVMSPCALVLSVPSAILSAIACGARHGVLFRGGAAIETLAGVSVVAMDKTGTLTEGRLQAASVEMVRGAEEELLLAAGNLARLSNHPHSRALARMADRRGLPREEPENVQNVPGAGLRAGWRGRPAVLGARELVGEVLPGVELPPPPQDASEVWLAAGSDLLGRIILRDQIRPQAKTLVAQLEAEGLRVVMLTGDRTGAAAKLAAEAGVKDVRSQLRPEDKVAAIQALKADGARVAMIGDGVNDAPCLAAADVGVAMGARGSDAAIEQAEVVLMNDRLENFLLARSLSCRARRIIRQNMLLALGVIVFMSCTTLLAAAMPLAVGVFAHEGSTVVVVMNSLRLLFRGRDSQPAPASSGGTSEHALA